MVTAPNAKIEQANGLKYKVRPIMDWDYLIKIARDENAQINAKYGNNHPGGGNFSMHH